MVKLLLTTVSLAALSVSAVNAGGLEHVGGYVSYSSSNDSDDRNIKTYGNFETRINRFTFDAEFTRNAELESEGRVTNFDEGSVTLRFGYQITDAFAANIGVRREADTNDASTETLLGLEYDAGGPMAELSFASGEDARTAILSVVSEQDNGLTLGAQLTKTWEDDDDEEDSTLVTAAARYTAPQFEVTGAAFRLTDTGESTVLLAASYDVAAGVSVLAGAGAFFDPEGADSRHYSIGARYQATPLMSVDAILANSVNDDGDKSRGFGIALNWDLGKRDNARSVMTGMQLDVAKIVGGYQ